MNFFGLFGRQASSSEKPERQEPSVAKPNTHTRPARETRVGTNAQWREFKGAIQDRLTADWLFSHRDADSEIKTALPRLRAVSRELERDNTYAKKFLSMVEQNVIGERGIRLQARARDDRGVLDKADNALIEEAWRKWGKKGVCTVDGRLSWIGVQNLSMRSVARDSEILIRKIRGEAAENDFGFAIQLIEGDQLDESYCVDLRDGRQIHMGVEMNKFRRVLAYHILVNHPGSETYNHGGRKYERIPADQIEHPYIMHRVGQTRGIPWMHAPTFKLKMLGAYEEAELVAARVGASKMGFFTKNDPDTNYAPDAEENGQLVTDAEAGIFEELPVGVGFESFDPQHPTQAFPMFCKAMLRGAAVGLDVSYHSLAGDLSDTNYSSLRQGALDERATWRKLQAWSVENIHDPIFQAWLPMALLTGALRLPIRKIEKFENVAWLPRGWQWVDPSKEVDASLKAIDGKLRSRTAVMADAGGDFEDTVEQLKQEDEILAEAGLSSNNNQGQSDVEDDEDSENDEE